MNTSEFWLESGVRTFSSSSHLPTITNPTPAKDILETAPRLLEDTLTVARLAKEEFGCGSQQAAMYDELAASQYAEIAHIRNVRLLNDRLADCQKGGQSLEDPEIAAKVIGDIDIINRLGGIAYGFVDPEQLSAIIARTTVQASKLLDDTENLTPEIETAAERIRATLPEVDMDLADKHIYRPTTEDIDYWGPLVDKKYQSLIDLIPERETPFLGPEVLDIVQDGLKVMRDDWGLERADEWTVQHGKSSLMVSQDGKIVWVPETLEKDTADCRAKIIHELGGHVLRYLIGELTGDALVTSGMPGRLIEEESLLTVVEQFAKRTAREPGVPQYLTIGMAQNVLGQSNPLPLSGLEEFLVDYDVVSSGKPMTEKKRAGRQRQAFRIAMNMPSVTINGKIYQAPYPSDLKYRIGQPPILDYFGRNIGNPAALDDAMLGKFAISRPEQIEYVRELHKNTSAQRTKIPSAA